MKAARAGGRGRCLDVPVLARSEVDETGGAKVLRDAGVGANDAPGADILNHGADIEARAEAAFESDVRRREVVFVVVRREFLIAVTPAGDERGFTPGCSDAEVKRGSHLCGVLVGVCE